jgi:glycosyltransferase involved in cell wall biosynthesis
LTVAIVAACPFPEPRGTPIRIQRTAEALAERGHRVHVVTYHLGTGAALPSITVHRTPTIRSYRTVAPGPTFRKLTLLDPLLTWKLRQVIRQQRVAVIHAHHYEGLMVAAAARRGTRIPVVFDAHTLLASELPSYRIGLPGPLKRVFAEGLDRRVPRWSDHVVSVTDTIRRKLIDAGTVPDSRITVISNGVEIELFSTEGAASTAPRGAERSLIFTGNLARYQRIDLLLGALRKVLDRRPGVRLTIVTESSFAPYESLAGELGVRSAIDLVNAGFDRIPALLATADVAVNPRIDCDGIPLKLLNYMAASRPVVSFVGSAPGIRDHDTGWLAPDGDVEAFAAGVVSLLGDPGLAERIGRNARRFVEEHHSWKRAAEKAEEVYRGLLAGNGAEVPDPAPPATRGRVSGQQGP